MNEYTLIFIAVGTLCGILIYLLRKVGALSRIVTPENYPAVAAPAPAAAAPAFVPAPAFIPAPAPEPNLAGDAQLVAVITAAIAAFEGSGSASGLMIRRISRVSGKATSWNTAGRTECIDVRRM